MSRKRNRGWFKRGDPRINRRGRPLGDREALTKQVETLDGTSPRPVCKHVPNAAEQKRLMVDLMLQKLAALNARLDRLDRLDLQRRVKPTPQAAPPTAVNLHASGHVDATSGGTASPNGAADEREELVQVPIPGRPGVYQMVRAKDAPPGARRYHD